MRRLAHALARRCHRIAKQRRSAIVQVLDQRSVITAGILVEQLPQIGSVIAGISGPAPRRASCSRAP